MHLVAETCHFIRLNLSKTDERKVKSVLLHNQLNNFLITFQLTF